MPASLAASIMSPGSATPCGEAQHLVEAEQRAELRLLVVVVILAAASILSSVPAGVIPAVPGARSVPGGGAGDVRSGAGERMWFGERGDGL